MAKSPYEPEWNDGSHRKGRAGAKAGDGTEAGAKIARMERCPKPKKKAAAKKKAAKKKAKKKTS